MQTLILCFSIFSNLLSFEILAESVFDVYAKSCKFSFNETLVSNIVLKIKTTREKRTGIVVWSAYQNIPIDNVFWDVKLFYRFGTIFRNYLINKKGVEICELFKDPKERKLRYNNPLANLAMKAAIPFTRKYAKGCPFPVGWYNGTLDVNHTVSLALPPIVPAGTYKVYSRIYYEDNSTLSEIEGIGYVKPNYKNRDKDFSMLNMG